eukprot:CAMPEP_0184503558 /NCGR_PEP_ID=MMETSP0113_2-20130426/51964_1 /TAXON_ID=91329 /ORGANISM="Norrisiella sphaerica, Strain BC52" /LENGTH=628 /DNA_ID=CAMNT_0026893081 /DNA_START=2342 /DNA_END=4228 /DNA_ORIENTATION=-
MEPNGAERARLNNLGMTLINADHSVCFETLWQIGAERARLNNLGMTLINADHSVCFETLWQILFDSGVPTIPPPPPPDFILSSILAFDSIFTLANAISGLADTRNQCLNSSGSIPSFETCASTETLQGQREFVIQFYNSTDFNTILGDMRPRNRFEVTRDYSVTNLRSSYILENWANPLTPRDFPVFREIGVVWQDTRTFTATSATFYNGGSTETPTNRVASPAEDKQFVSQYSGVGITFFVFLVIFSIASISWVLYNWSLPIIKATQPSFLIQTLFGSFVSSLVIILTGLDDESLSFSTLDSICTAQIYFFGFGFAITCTALLAKLWRAKVIIYSAVKNLELVRVPLSQMFLMTIGGLSIEALTIGIWNSFHKLSWTRSCVERDEFGACLKSRGFCTTDDPWSIIAPIVVIHVGTMLYALYICYQCRDLPESFAEVKWITTAMFSNLQIFVLGIFLLVLLHDNPQVFYLITVGIVFLQEGSVLFCMFIPKVFQVYFPGEDEGTKKVLKKMEADLKVKQSSKDGKKSSSGVPKSKYNSIPLQHSSKPASDQRSLASLRQVGKGGELLHANIPDRPNAQIDSAFSNSLSRNENGELRKELTCIQGGSRLPSSVALNVRMRQTIDGSISP